MTARILIVDDEKNIRNALAVLLRREGYDAQVEGDPEAALDLVRAAHFNIVLSDLRMELGNGIQLLDRIRQIRPDCETVIMTAYASVDTAVEAMRCGAYDYISKPIDPERLRRLIQQILERQSLMRENASLRRRLSVNDQFGRLIGNSPRMHEVFRVIDAAAPSRATVLITGESGTGKELVARAIHERSPRASGPLISINCGAIPETLLESELFGYNRGAFTGADREQPGRIEAASGGTLFLDEVGEMSRRTQVELLRVLQEREVRRLGTSRAVQVDVRVVAATNKDPREEVRSGRFRDDLYYRLNVVSLHLPPLRERSEDIRLLVEVFNAEFAELYGTPVKVFTAPALELLVGYAWPGNVRELRNVIERIAILVREVRVQPAHIRTVLEGAETNRPEVRIPLGTSLRTAEELLIRRTLEVVTSHRERAAKLLGISPRALHYKLRRYGLDEGRGGSPEAEQADRAGAVATEGEDRTDGNEPREAVADLPAVPATGSAERTSTS